MDSPVINLDGVINTLKSSNNNMSLLITTISGLFPRITGTFTMAAAATKTVPEPSILSTSYVVLIPTNAAAATLVGSTRSPYVSTKTAGASFVVSTASGVAAAGSETFQYLIFNPV